MSDRVYKFGCRPPREHDIAVQLLGQAFNYAEDLRRAYNDHARALRELRSLRDDEHAHVVSHQYELLKAALRRVREGERRGHLLDAGTYWLLESAALQASKASRLDPIKRAHWDGTGRIGAMIQSTTQFPATRLKHHGVQWRHARVSLTEPNERGHAELTIAVGAFAEGRTITWPIKLHRPFPDGSVVKQVVVQRTRVGHRFRWEALFTICVSPDNQASGTASGLDDDDDACGSPRSRDQRARGVVGIDVGWRRDGDSGMRVATHDASDGGGVLHIDTASAYAYCDSIRGFRDEAFDAAKAYVAESRLPGGEHAKLWRDKGRMTRLRQSAPDDLGVAWYVERDKHLEDIECGVRTRAIRRRLDAFRTYADALARRYRIVVLEDMPMLDWVGEAETHKKERQRSTAALALLQLVLSQRFGADRTDWVSSTNTSRTCSSCSEVRLTPIGTETHWACACGAVHHQDENAAKVLRNLGERWSDAGNAVRARGRKPKKGRVNRKGVDIATGDETGMVITAREPSDKAAE